MVKRRLITRSSLKKDMLQARKPAIKRGRPSKPIDGGSSKRTPSKRVKRSEDQYRSNLQTVIKIVNSFSLTDAHIKLLKESFPFWDLYDLILHNGIDNAMCKKSDIDVAQIITHFDKKRCSFDLGGTYVLITKKDVQDIFGISGGQTKITVEKSIDKTDLYTRRFSKTKTLNKKVLSSLLSTVIKGQSKDDMEDVPKLLTLLLLDVFFVPTRSTSLKKAYIEYVDDLSKIKTFDWSGHIFEKLLSSICEHKSKNPRKVTGCVMALPYWLMENFNIGKPKNPDARLLCQKWNLQDLTYSTKKMTISKVCQDKGRRINEEESTEREVNEGGSYENEGASKEECKDAKGNNNEENDEKDGYDEYDEEDGNDEYNGYGKSIAYYESPLRSYEGLEDEVSDDTPLVVAVSQSKEVKERIKELREVIKKKDEALVGAEKELISQSKEMNERIKELGEEIKRKDEALVGAEKELVSQSKEMKSRIKGLGEEIKKKDEALVGAGKELVLQSKEMKGKIKELGEEIEKIGEGLVGAEKELEEMRKNVQQQIDQFAHDLSIKTKDLEESRKVQTFLREQLAELKTANFDRPMAEGEILFGEQQTDTLFGKQIVEEKERVEEQQNASQSVQEEEVAEKNRDDQVREVLEANSVHFIDEHNAESGQLQEQQRDTHFDKQMVEETAVEDHQKASESVQKVVNNAGSTQLRKRQRDVSVPSFDLHIDSQESIDDEHNTKLGHIQEQETDTPFSKPIVKEEVLVEEQQKASQSVQETDTLFDKQIVEEEAIEEQQKASQSVQKGILDEEAAKKNRDAQVKEIIEFYEAHLAYIAEEEDRRQKEIRDAEQIFLPEEHMFDASRENENHEALQFPIHQDEGMVYERVDSEEEDVKDKEPNSRIVRIKNKERKGAKRDPNYDWGSGKRRRKKRKAVAEEVDPEETDSEEAEVETIDVDELPDVSVAKIKKESRIDKSWDLANFFTDEEFNKLQQIHDKNGVTYDTILWTKPGVIDSYVTLADIYLILEHEELANNLINAHAELLRRKYNPEPLKNFVIFDSLIWTYVVRRDQHNFIRKERIDNIIKQYCKDDLFWGKMLFPMNSNGHKNMDIAPGHWTLLVFDVKYGKWQFYNSKRPRTNNSKDKYVKDALVVKKYVEEMMEGSSNCAREEDEKKIVYDYPLFRCANSIQQEPDSLDCGVIVCYLMEAIASGQILKPSLSMEELATYKAGLVSRLVKEYK